MATDMTDAIVMSPQLAPGREITRATEDSRPAAKARYMRSDREPVGPKGRTCRRPSVLAPGPFRDTSHCRRSRRSEEMLVFAKEAKKRSTWEIMNIRIGNKGPLLSLSISGCHVLLCDLLLYLLGLFVLLRFSGRHWSGGDSCYEGVGWNVFGYDCS